MPGQERPATVTARVTEIVFDCENPKRVATFWSSLLGVDVEDETHEEQLWFVGLYPIAEGGPIIGFQRVPESKSGKNRVHLDLAVADLEQASGRVAELGGRLLTVHHERGRAWREMADPEGNEFCLTIAE